MHCMCVDSALSFTFQKLGYLVGKYPGYFVIVPFFIACILGTGLQRLRYEDDPEYLFSPTDGRSKVERAIVDEYFPINYTHNFNLGRITHKGRFGRLIITAKDGGDILRRVIWDELVQLDSAIKNLTITWDDSVWNYGDMCAKQEFKCWNNDILDFDSKISDIEAKKYFLKYPIWINYETYKAYFFPAHLGGVKTDDNGLIESAKGINLMYFLDTTIKNGDFRGQLWEQKFLDYAANVQFDHIIVSRFISTTLQKELDSNTHSLVPFFSITIIIMILFSVGTCMMSDWVRSKPWLGVLACVSAGIAVVAAFGLCVYCGIEMIGINLAAPFLMIGVGMDDAFVLLAAWRRTSPSLTIPERLSLTYGEAAVSITITSLTNFISFMIGIITPFPSVRIFCIYTAVAVLFTYAYHITFFGGLMAYFGRIEQKNLHGLICVPVLPKSLAADKGLFFRLFCTGGRNPADPDNEKDNREHVMMIFFRDYLAESLNRPLIKLLVILIFLLYLLIGIYGCSVIKEGLDRRKLSRDDSYSVQFYDFEDKYFREFPYRIQVVINETLNYSDPAVQNKVEAMLQTFENSPYVADKSLTESWLRAYLSFLAQEDSYLFLQALNLSDPNDFNRGLRDIFIHFPLTEQFRYDVVFNEDGSEIIASRFIIQTKNILDANMEKEMLIALREIAEKFSFSVIIYHHYFIFFDQFVLVRSISIQTITVAAIVMMAISLIFIPSPSCALWVAFSIISIEIGVIGYMTLWNVNLDSISMINLIMCIGFSVDFSAHISYAYNSSERSTPNERVREAMYSLGLPIFQGSVSTVLGIIALAFAPSYVFVTFFKTVFLVMLFGATHGIFLLPVLLSLTDICRPTRKIRDDALTTNDNNSSHSKLKPNSNRHSYIVSNLQVAHKEIDFFSSDKYFNGKTIVSKNRPPIYIPRPSFIDMNNETKMVKQKAAADEVGSVEGSKSLSMSNSSIVAEKDLGLGTSAEECSESSWKGEKNETEIIDKQPKRGNNGEKSNNTRWNQLSRVNDGYVSDTGDTDNEHIPCKSNAIRTKSNDFMEPSITSGHHNHQSNKHHNNKQSKQLAGKHSSSVGSNYQQYPPKQKLPIGESKIQYEKPKRRYSHNSHNIPHSSHNQFRIGNVKHHPNEVNQLNYYDNWNTSWLEATDSAQADSTTSLKFEANNSNQSFR